MKFRIFSAAVTLAFATAGAMAQDAWPNKPIKLIAPFAAGWPKPVIDKLYAETVRVMKLPDVVESYAKIGFDARTNTPTELAAVMKKELELWGPVVKSTSASTN